MRKNSLYTFTCVPPPPPAQNGYHAPPSRLQQEMPPRKLARLMSPQPPPPPPAKTTSSAVTLPHQAVSCHGPSSMDYSLPSSTLTFPEFDASRPPPPLPISLFKHKINASAEAIDTGGLCINCVRGELRISKYKEEMERLCVKEEQSDITFNKKLQIFEMGKELLRSIISSEMFIILIEYIEGTPSVHGFMTLAQQQVMKTFMRQVRELMLGAGPSFDEAPRRGERGAGAGSSIHPPEHLQWLPSPLHSAGPALPPPPHSAGPAWPLSPHSAGPAWPLSPHSAGPALPPPPHSAGPALPPPPHSAGPALPPPPHSAGPALPPPPHSAGPAWPPPPHSAGPELPPPTGPPPTLSAPPPRYAHFSHSNLYSWGHETGDGRAGYRAVHGRALSDGAGATGAN